VLFGFFAARYAGFTIQEVMYDPDKMPEAQLKTVIEFEPDLDMNPYGTRFLGPILESLDFKQLLWPGHGLTADHSYQFVEGEYMTADECDHFLLDTTDFMMRRHWLRVCGGLKGFEKLPPLHNIISYYMDISSGFGAFSLPEVIQALDVLKKPGRESGRLGS
jgi:hypothetical protein